MDRGAFSTSSAPILAASNAAYSPLCGRQHRHFGDGWIAASREWLEVEAVELERGVMSTSVPFRDLSASSRRRRKKC